MEKYLGRPISFGMVQSVVKPSERCWRSMNENVAALRARWTPETTAAAIAFLQGKPVEHSFPQLEQDGVVYTDLRGVSIEQAQFDGAVFTQVNLRWTTFHDIGFKDAQLQTCNLSHVTFTACYFRRTQFLQCDMVNAKFDGCDFSNARLEFSKLDFATFKNSEIRLENIKFRADANPLMLVRVCRNLKLNAMSMGHFSDAGELTFREKTFERFHLYNMAFRPQEHQNPGARVKFAVEWVSSILLNLLWGYGEKPVRLLGAIVVNILLFGVIQYLLGAVPDKALWEHIYFSGITFLTVGYGDLSPIGMLPRFIAVLEGAAGIGTTGLLIASATKKIMYR